MASLTITAYHTRRIVKYTAIGFVVFLVIRAGLGIFITYWKNAHPAPPPPPNMAFGKLPQIKFPQNISEQPNLSYKLETIEGTLPVFMAPVKVYFVPQSVPNLLALDRARELAASIGFLSEPVQVSERVFRFTGENSASTLEIDIIDQKFKMTYDFTNDSEVLFEKKLPDELEAPLEAKNFLKKAGILKPELENGTTKVEFLKYYAPNFKPVISLSEADFIKVYLYQKNLDDLKILPPNPSQSLISFIFSGARNRAKRIIEINYFYNQASSDEVATYPLKTSQSAWQELTEGKGYIANLGNNPDGQITVRKLSLAYFEADTYQKFLQPIYVFEGDRNFIGYVPAVDSVWIE